MREEDFDEEREEMEEEMRLEKIQLDLRLKKVRVVAEDNKNRRETLELNHMDFEISLKRARDTLDVVDAVMRQVKKFKEEFDPTSDLEQRVNWRIVRALENALPTFI